MTLRRLRGRPRLPVRSLTASSNGSTCARSSALAGVVRLARGMPPPSVRLGIRSPLPLPPRATPSPPPLPGGKRAIHGAILPAHHASFLCNPQNAGLHGGQRAIRVPPWQPPMRRALRRPLRPARDSTPAAPCKQNVKQGIEDCPKRHMGHPTPPLRRSRGKHILK